MEYAPWNLRREMISINSTQGEFPMELLIKVLWNEYHGGNLYSVTFTSLISFVKCGCILRVFLKYVELVRIS